MMYSPSVRRARTTALRMAVSNLVFDPIQWSEGSTIMTPSPYRARMRSAASAIEAAVFRPTSSRIICPGSTLFA